MDVQMSNVIQLFNKKEEAKCSFCSNTVTKFVQNKQNGKTICHKCIALAAKKLEE